MGWTPFKVDIRPVPPATVATFATVDDKAQQDQQLMDGNEASGALLRSATVCDASSAAGRTVATVATVAGAPPEICDPGTAQTVATVASVAGGIAESGDPAIARLRDDARIAVRQADPFRCLTCGRPDRDGDPLVPVLSARDRDHIWLHLGACHAAYRAHMAERAAEMARDEGA